MGWRPIEEAPKDGTLVLLYIPGQTASKTVVGYRQSMAVGFFREEYDTFWQLAESGGYAEDADIYPAPTFFMPLPTPPQDT